MLPDRFGVLNRKRGRRIALFLIRRCLTLNMNTQLNGKVENMRTNRIRARRFMTSRRLKNKKRLNVNLTITSVPEQVRVPRRRSGGPIRKETETRA